MRAATATKAIQDRFRDDGLEAMNMSPEEFNQFMAREVAGVSRLVSDLGLQKQ